MEEGLTSGVVMGYPVVDTAVTVIGGKFTPGLSTELGFRLACSMALKQGMEKANSVLLEAHHEGGGHRARGVHGRGHR